MRKSQIFASLFFVGVGIIFGVILLANFSENGLQSLLAGGVSDIGAKNAPVTLNENVKALNNAFVAVSEASNETVVSISVVAEKKVAKNQMREFFRFFGEPFDPRDNKGNEEEEPDTEESSGAGSGVILSADGYIATNNHVVEDAKDDGIKVILHDKREFKAKLIGRDPLTDLAVIKIDVNNLKPAHFANSDQAQIGEWVIAVGNPLGLRSTVTTGIISALGRGQLNLNNDQYAVENFIQTDAAINPGNSGGGLFNLNGSLVGINTAIASRTGYYNGYGFAIPANLVKSVVLDLIEDGKVDRGYIGVQISSVDEVSAKSYKLDKVAGVIVQKVLEGSPAEKAGLEIGDVILDLDGMPVNTSNELQSRVSMHKAGDDVKLKILRDGKAIYKTVTLKPRDEDSKTASNDVKTGKSEDDEINKPVKFEKLGFSVSPVTTKVKEDLGIDKGIIINTVERYGEAASRGIVPNGVILKANNQEISTTGQFKKIIEQNAGEVVRLQVKYKDGARLVFIEVPKNNS